MGLPLHFWGDAVQYAVYILNRSPTRANTKQASPIKVLTGTAPDLREIVLFGSLCSVYRDPRNNSLQHRAQITTIIGISEELKGYKVCLRKENRVIVTQHVQNIDTLSDAQNSQLQNVMNNKDRDVTARDSIPAAASASTAADNNDVFTCMKGLKRAKRR